MAVDPDEGRLLEDYDIPVPTGELNLFTCIWTNIAKGLVIHIFYSKNSTLRMNLCAQTKQNPVLSPQLRK